MYLKRTRRILKRDRKFTRFSASDAIFRREEKRLVYVIYKGKSKNVQVRAMAEDKSRYISPVVSVFIFSAMHKIYIWAVVISEI